MTASPILSPVFQAGGIEEIQFMLYPKGYPEAEGVIGFFVAVPPGSYIKCR